MKACKRSFSFPCILGSVPSYAQEKIKAAHTKEKITPRDTRSLLLLFLRRRDTKTTTSIRAKQLLASHGNKRLIVTDAPDTRYSYGVKE
jgi:hypothetical protein